MYSFTIFWLIVTLASVSANENISDEYNSSTLPQNRFPPLEDDYLSALNLTASNEDYEFVVLIIHAGKVYGYGIYFRPRFVLIAYTKLRNYKNLDLLVAGWNNSRLQDEGQVRKVIDVISYPNDKSCDLDLSLIEIEHPFRGSTFHWHVKFMGKKKPAPGTSCLVIHLNEDRFETANAIVRDWTKYNCSQVMYRSKCDESNVLCLSSMVSVEVDVTGSPVLCNNKVAGVVPGFFIHDLMTIQYLPSYKSWIGKHSDNSLYKQWLRSDASNLTLLKYISDGLIIILNLIYTNAKF
ncbi:hypothetical protein Trydic_g501 [Trypoxylus dichotomus]